MISTMIEYDDQFIATQYIINKVLIYYRLLLDLTVREKSKRTLVIF